jgi:SET domain-containing protein
MLLEAGPAAEAFELLDDAQWEQVHELQRRIAHKVMRESRVRGRQPELEAETSSRRSYGTGTRTT